MKELKLINKIKDDCIKLAEDEKMDDFIEKGEEVTKEEILIWNGAIEMVIDAIIDSKE